jgi:hypothetical protein
VVLVEFSLPEESLETKSLFNILVVILEIPVLSDPHRLLSMPESLTLINLELFLVLMDMLQHVVIDNLYFGSHQTVTFLRQLLQNWMVCPLLEPMFYVG